MCRLVWQPGSAAIRITAVAPAPSAAHLFSDLVSFGVGILSVVIARKPASKAMTFGYARLELVGALFSIFLIWVTTGVLCYEAVRRILHPEHVDGRIMFLTACGALIVNLALLRILHSVRLPRDGYSRLT